MQEHSRLRPIYNGENLQTVVRRTYEFVSFISYSFLEISVWLLDVNSATLAAQKVFFKFKFKQLNSGAKLTLMKLSLMLSFILGA